MPKALRVLILGIVEALTHFLAVLLPILPNFKIEIPKIIFGLNKLIILTREDLFFLNVLINILIRFKFEIVY